ncbi:hypothetical protein [Spirosoma fluviale]|uniref:Uncharacterized protein n=1 Tax=Spirosoma fluviale TaxID=1597977 RepID=A0A286FCC5_9BACT|nr:hypothetical protein [Spirosoma fluviale]SOD80843.1 hypothetical protein SAMN06269250_1585 [Spirosoma fluviale]
MKPATRTLRQIDPNYSDKQWKLSYQIAGFHEQLNRLPDAANVKANRKRSVPLQELPMIF